MNLQLIRNDKTKDRKRTDKPHRNWTCYFDCIVANLKLFVHTVSSYNYNFGKNCNWPCSTFVEPKGFFLPWRIFFCQKRTGVQDDMPIVSSLIKVIVANFIMDNNRKLCQLYNVHYTNQSMMRRWGSDCALVLLPRMTILKGIPGLYSWSRRQFPRRAAKGCKMKNCKRIL